MPSVIVKQELDGKPDAVFKKLKTYCDKKLILKELGNLKPEVEWEPKKRKGTFNEKGVEGLIEVKEESPCVVSITMQIPFFLIPFKGVIETSIRNHLGRID